MLLSGSLRRNRRGRLPEVCQRLAATVPPPLVGEGDALEMNVASIETPFVRRILEACDDPGGLIVIDGLKRGMPPACALLLALLFVLRPAVAGDFPVRGTHGAIAIARKVCGPLFLPTYAWRADYADGSWHARAVSRDTKQVLFSIDIPVRGPAGTCYQAATED